MTNLVLLPLLPVILSAAPAAAPGGAQPWLAWLGRARTYLDGIDGYTAIYHKKELLHGTELTDETMRLKFKKPFNVYLEWANPGGKGGEAIYVEGWNDNRVKVHPGGFWGLLKFNLVPDSRWILRYNRHPITDLGLDRLVTLVDGNVRRALAAGVFVSVDHGRMPRFGRTATVLEGILPADPAAGYYCRRALVWVDSENSLPLNIAIYDWQDRLVEEYGYENFRTDVSLTAADFNPDNPDYRF